MPVTSASNVLSKPHHETTLPLIATDLHFDVLQIPLVTCSRDHWHVLITSLTIHPTALPWCQLLRAPILEMASHIAETSYGWKTAEVSGQPLVSLE